MPVQQSRTGTPGSGGDHAGREPPPGSIDVQAEQVVEEIVPARDRGEHPPHALVGLVGRRRSRRQVFDPCRRESFEASCRTADFDIRSPNVLSCRVGQRATHMNPGPCGGLPALTHPTNPPGLEALCNSMVYSGTRGRLAASRNRAEIGISPSCSDLLSPGHRSRIRRGVRTRLSTADSPEQGRSMTPKRALVILIVVSALVRLVAASSLGLGNDEAYHFLYAVHPEPELLRPPADAGLGRDGRAWRSPGRPSRRWRCGRDSSCSSRARRGCCGGSPVDGMGPGRGSTRRLALNLTGYYGLAASTFALPDGPLLFFWLLTIDRLSLALEQPGPHRGPGSGWGWPGAERCSASTMRSSCPPGLVLLLVAPSAAAALAGQAGALPGDRRWASWSSAR